MHFGGSESVFLELMYYILFMLFCAGRFVTVAAHAQIGVRLTANTERRH